MRKKHLSFAVQTVLLTVALSNLVLTGCASRSGEPETSSATGGIPAQVTESIAVNPEPSPTPIVCRELGAEQAITVTFPADARVRVEVRGLPPHTAIQVVYTASVHNGVRGHAVRYESAGVTDDAGRYTDENDFDARETGLDVWRVAVVYGNEAICSEFTLP